MLSIVDGVFVSELIEPDEDPARRMMNCSSFGRFIADAIRAGATEPNRVRAVLEMTTDEYDALIGMSENSAIRT